MTSELDDLRSRVRLFVEDRDWARFHDAKNLAMCLAAEVGELVAELRWVRTSEVGAALNDPTRRTRFEAEIGDVLISLIMLADATGTDLVRAGKAKLEHNGTKYPVERTRGRADPPP